MPLVSCIMPTANRRHLIPMALKCYLVQDWEEKELIVVDDGAVKVADLLEDVPNVTYVGIEAGKTVSEKVNLCCELAHGDVIATWDDDDFSAPGRLTDQVTRLMESRRPLTGYHSMLFYDGQRAWKYLGSQNYTVGTSQVYLKSFWEKHRFLPKDVSYDNDLWKAAVDCGPVPCVDAGQKMVARIHRQNVSGQRPALGCHMWPEVPVSEIPRAFFEALG